MRISPRLITFMTERIEDRIELQTDLSFRADLDPAGIWLTGSAERETIDLAGLQEQITSLQNQFGISAHIENGIASFSYRAGGETRNLPFQFQATADGLVMARMMLEQHLERQIAGIETQFGVHIARQGEEVPNPFRFRGGDITRLRRPLQSDTITAVAPTFGQLVGLEAALNQTNPHFRLPENNVTNYFYLQSEQQPSVFHSEGIGFSGIERRHPPTNRDVGSPIVDGISSQYSGGHENVHLSQSVLGWGTPEDLRAIGWVHRLDESGRQQHELMGADGSQYQFQTGSFGDLWFRKNAQGQYLDREGNIVSSQEEAERLTSDEVRQRSLFPIMTNYFDRPHEMHADLVELYTRNEESRIHLLLESPELYRAIQNYDQRVINLHYSLDGSTSHIRLPNGSIVPNTLENRRIVLNFEGSARRQPY